MTSVDSIAHALLYEGYLLYPYRADTAKNRQRFTFGALFPPDYVGAHQTEACRLQTECLVESNGEAAITVRVRFLQMMARDIEKLVDCDSVNANPLLSYEPVDALTVDGRTYQTWQEALEREVTLPSRLLDAMLGETMCFPFSFSEDCQFETLTRGDGRPTGRIRRRLERITGSITLSAEHVAEGLDKLRVEVTNDALSEKAGYEDRDAALMDTLVSTHTILHVEHGGFVSLLDPPEHWQSLAAECRNVGTWPILVGQAPERETMLSSPIILYDYPEVAQESPGDLCDSTEIDEILMLRIMTLTDEEKQAVRDLDPLGREILERTEMLPEEHFQKMHGAIRALRPVERGS